MRNTNTVGLNPTRGSVKIMKWTIENKKNLIEHHNAGLNSFEIANKFNFTRKQVTNKLRLLGIKTDTSKSYKHLDKKQECLNCKKVFEFKKNKNKGRKFCSKKCFGHFNLNKDEDGNVIIKKREKNCLFCNKALLNDSRTKRQSKFCSNICCSSFKRCEKFKKIENGDLTLDTRQYKNYLIHKHGEKCMECGWNKKSPYSNKIPVELEHVDGNSENNELSNLKLLCPNCHSLTPTYKALNIGKGRHSRKLRYKEGKIF